jgi:large conductance mechanosensitive channel
MLKEFRDFINRGNVIDLAIAVIMGAAFTAIVNSFVDDIVMPFIGVLLGGVDFSSLVITFGQATITYGNFIQAIINFLLIALVLFFLVRAINRMSAKKEVEEAVAAEPSKEEKLLAEIRDLLRDRNP